MSPNRYENIELLFQTSQQLLVPVSSAITSIVFFHRYADFDSSVENFRNRPKDLTILIAALIFLACKVDEQKRNLRDVIAVVRKLLAVNLADDLHEYEECNKYKAHVVNEEQVILRAIGFKTHVDIPHKGLCLNQQTVKIAWRSLTDYHISPLCTQNCAAAMACGALYFAMQIMGVEHVSCDEARQSNVHASSWWRACGADDDSIHAIAADIARMYEHR